MRIKATFNGSGYQLLRKNAARIDLTLEAHKIISELVKSLREVHKDNIVSDGSMLRSVGWNVRRHRSMEPSCYYCRMVNDGMRLLQQAPRAASVTIKTKPAPTSKLLEAAKMARAVLGELRGGPHEEPAVLRALCAAIAEIETQKVRVI